MGETRVDLVHLLEDLRDAYPASLEETILTEIVANALDSGAGRLEFVTEAGSSWLTAIDNGTGMTRRELSRYHDLATTSKRRGRGIGFAGVGIKLGLLASEEVVTETRRSGKSVATSWRLSNRSRAPWSWVDPPGTLVADGTAVSLRVSNALSPLLDPGFLEGVVLRNFQPLFEPEFLEILASSYPAGLTVEIDGRVVVGPIRRSERVPIAIRVGRQRKPSIVGYLARYDESLPEPERGIGISTLGKVIRRGWDWLSMSPADGYRIEGLIEAPMLAEALTLNKGDFLRTGERGARFLAIRKSIQEAVASQLEAWGGSPPLRKQPRTRPMEKDLGRVLGAMADDFPILTTLTERHSGGQRLLPLGDPLAVRSGTWAGTLPLRVAEPKVGEPEDGGGGKDDDAGTGPRESAGSGSGADADRTEPPAGNAPPNPASTAAPAAELPGSRRKRKPVRLSLAIQFESRPGSEQLGRLVESTVWINDAHPAYRRASISRSEGYHVALAVAASLAPLAVEPARGQDFINAFLARWGEAGAEAGKSRR